jgi:hypothetical protein
MLPFFLSGGKETFSVSIHSYNSSSSKFNGNWPSSSRVLHGQADGRRRIVTTSCFESDNTPTLQGLEPAVPVVDWFETVHVVTDFMESSPS